MDLVYTGKTKDSYELGCELQKKRIECAIMMKAAEADMEAQQDA